MTAGLAQAFYVYSVLPATGGVPSADGVLPGVPVDAIRFADLTVLTSVVPRALFDSEDAANRTADPDWMAARLQAHHAVNVAAAADGPCLPLAFGALFSRVGLLHDWLIPRAAALQTALARVGGQTEWALSMQEDAAAHAVWLDREDTDLRRLAETVAAAGEGTAFLLARRLEKARTAARAAHIGVAAATVAAQLGDAGFDLLDDPPRTGLPGWTLLVRSRTPAVLAQPNTLSGPAQVLAERVQMLAADLAPAGLSLRLSGPWPAYAFARAALAQESALAQEHVQVAMAQEHVDAALAQEHVQAALAGEAVHG